MTLRVVSGLEDLAEIVPLLVRFEVLHSELPANKKQAKEFNPSVIEQKVTAICEVRRKVIELCKVHSAVNTVIPGG